MWEVHELDFPERAISQHTISIDAISFIFLLKVSPAFLDPHKAVEVSDSMEHKFCGACSSSQLKTELDTAS